MDVGSVIRDQMICKSVHLTRHLHQRDMTGNG